MLCDCLHLKDGTKGLEPLGSKSPVFVIVIDPKRLKLNKQLGEIDCGTGETDKSFWIFVVEEMQPLTHKEKSVLQRLAAEIVTATLPTNK